MKAREVVSFAIVTFIALGSIQTKAIDKEFLVEAEKVCAFEGRFLEYSELPEIHCIVESETSMVSVTY